MKRLEEGSYLPSAYGGDDDVCVSDVKQKTQPEAKVVGSVHFGSLGLSVTVAHQNIIIFS